MGFGEEQPFELHLPVFNRRKIEQETKPPLHSTIAAILGATGLNVQPSGTNCSVPAGDIPALSYFLSCLDPLLNSLLINHYNWRDLIDYQNAPLLSYDRQKALIQGCLLFNPLDVFNKLIILDDDYVLLPKGKTNKFCGLDEVTGVVAVSSETVVGGMETKVTKIMLCTTGFVEKYWVKPMVSLKQIVAEVAKKSLKETNDFLHAVKPVLAMSRLNLVGRMDVSSPPSSNPMSSLIAPEYFWCDMCKKKINGARFKCRECFNLDLCRGCYQSKNDTHLKCRFWLIPKEGDSSIDMSPRIQCDHPHTACDMCKKQRFDGARFQCRECDDYDLCHECYQNKSDAHLKCRFWLILKEGDSKIGMPPRAQKTTPSSGMRKAPAVPFYTPSSDPPIAEAYPVNPDPCGPSAPSYSTVNQSRSAQSPAPQLTPVPVVQVENFLQGQSVLLNGLSDTSMNGKVGVVEKSLSGGKFVVVISDVGKTVVRAENMEVIGEDPNYPLNACVELTGLTNTKENGKSGVIVGFDIDRLLVKLLDKERILKVRKRNVLVVDESG